MKRKHLIVGACAAFALAFPQACANEGEGAGMLSLHLKVSGLDGIADAGDVPIDASAALINFESAELSTEAATAEAAAASKDLSRHGGDSEENEPGAPITVGAEPGLIDLIGDPDPLSGEFPLIENAFALSGEYTQLSISAGPGEIGAEELTFLFEGEIECVGGGNPETLSLKLDADLDDLAVLAVDLDVENLGTSELEVGLDLSELLAGVDVCALATLEGTIDEGAIEISTETAEAAEEMMNEALHNAMVEAIESVEGTLGAAFTAPEEHKHE